MSGSDWQAHNTVSVKAVKYTVSPKGQPLTGVVIAEVTFNASDIVDLCAAKGVVVISNSGGSFKIDAAISGSTENRERPLQVWQSAQNEHEAGFGIEDDPTLHVDSKSKQWDQFAANERLFGIKSQWDEDMYTHKLDKKNPDFRAREVAAAVIAREIESIPSSNSHVLEERGYPSQDTNLTEEEKYSGVHRSNNRWIPPAQRFSSVATSGREGIIDPAIIASQLARPGTNHKFSPSVSSAAVLPSGELSSSPASRVAGPEQSKGNVLIENSLMGTFKQFVTGERERMVQKKQALFKKEKDGRLQDLLKFSQSFKLNTPVPADLIPILAKDKSKQDAIVKKAVASSVQLTPSESNSPTLAEVMDEESLKSRIDKAHQLPTPLASPTPLSQAHTKEIKRLKPTAIEFKPLNPAVSPFASVPITPKMVMASPALSSTSSQLRHTPGDAITFFANRKSLPTSAKKRILDEFDPFRRYCQIHKEASLEIEEPFRTPPTWLAGKDTGSFRDTPRPSPKFYATQPAYEANGDFSHFPGPMFPSPNSGNVMPYYPPASQFYRSLQQVPQFVPASGQFGYQGVPPPSFVSSGNFIQYQAAQAGQNYPSPRAIQAQLLPLAFIPQQPYIHPQQSNCCISFVQSD